MLLVGGLEHEWIMTFHSVGNLDYDFPFSWEFGLFFHSVGNLDYFSIQLGME